MASIEIIGDAYRTTDPTLVDKIYRLLIEGDGAQTLTLRATWIGEIALLDPEEDLLEEGLFGSKETIMPVDGTPTEEELTILPFTMSLNARSMLSFGDVTSDSGPYGAYELSSESNGKFINYELLIKTF